MSSKIFYRVKFKIKYDEVDETVDIRCCLLV